MSSHSFGHFYAEQCQSVRQNGERSPAQIEPEITHVFVFADNLTVEIEFIESRRQINGVTGYVKRFEFLYRSLTVSGKFDNTVTRSYSSSFTAATSYFFGSPPFLRTLFILAAVY